MTTDSIPVFETSLGFCYGNLVNGVVTISAELAHNNLERSDNEKKYIEDKNKLRTFLVQKDSDKRSIGNLRRINARQQTRNLGVPSSFLCSKKGLVILVNFFRIFITRIVFCHYDIVTILIGKFTKDFTLMYITFTS